MDDCSTDGSIDFVERNYPSVKVIKNDINKGFAGAVNSGIRCAIDQGADYIAICNSDIQVLPEWIDLGIDIFHKQPKVGLVGYTEIPKEKEELFYGAKDLEGEVEYNEVKGLPGCLYLCPSRVFKHIGLFDEEYYMYGEDNDFFYKPFPSHTFLLNSVHCALYSIPIGKCIFQENGKINTIQDL